MIRQTPVSYTHLDVYKRQDQDKADKYLPVCQENCITFEAFSPLEQGLLSGKIGMDYVVPEGCLLYTSRCV